MVVLRILHVLNLHLIWFVKLKHIHGNVWNVKHVQNVVIRKMIQNFCFVTIAIGKFRVFWQIYFEKKTVLHSSGYHMYCCSPPLSKAPEGDWRCKLCCAQFGELKSWFIYLNELIFFHYLKIKSLNLIFFFFLSHSHTLSFFCNRV